MPQVKPQHSNLIRMLPSLLCWLALSLPLAAALQRPSVCYACVPESIKNKTAIGFHLGQSYGYAKIQRYPGGSVSLAHSSSQNISVILRQWDRHQPRQGPRKP